MLESSNPVSIILDAIFAILNVALAVVFGYLGTITTYALGALVAVGIIFAVIAGARAFRPRSRDAAQGRHDAT
ncbi:MAG: hypothetical protein JNL45_12840 [Hyphomicrobium sp.]|jgi:hypothetical protein|nr:hypothetical protein [Hyphomicrobium sp.]